MACITKRNRSAYVKSPKTTSIRYLKICSPMLELLVAELFGARGRGLHRRDEVRLDRALVEDRNRALGGAALRRHLRAQRRGREVGSLRELDGAGERRIRELARVGIGEAQLPRRILERLEEVERIGGTAAADARDRIEHVLARDPDDVAD